MGADEVLMFCRSGSQERETTRSTSVDDPTRSPSRLVTRVVSLRRTTLYVND